MANELDERRDPRVGEKGNDAGVIEKQLTPKVGTGTVVFFKYISWFLLIIPGIVFLVKRLKAEQYLSQLQQKIQASASQIDNYMEQRVMELQNTAKLLDKAIDLDKDTFTKIAQLRSGNTLDDNARNEVAKSMDQVAAKINVALENYPQLAAHQEIEDAMKKNTLTQREITAARDLYNSTVFEWNAAIYEWPHKLMVASKKGYTTRIPFATTSEIKEKARGVFF